MTNIASAGSIAEVAALIGDPARANMLMALMSGQALTAGELAVAAGVSAQTTSGHLAKLMESRLVKLERQQGRHRYFRLASPEAAQALEVLSSLAAEGPKRYRPPGPKDAALRYARSCYDHLAGQLGVALADSFHARELVVMAEGAASVTDEGRRFFSDAGIDLAGNRSTRPLCRTCLDWSERRPHLAGRLGAAILTHALDQQWLTRVSASRALSLTRKGQSEFVARFGLNVT